MECVAKSSGRNKFTATLECMNIQEKKNHVWHSTIVRQKKMPTITKYFNIVGHTSALFPANKSPPSIPCFSKLYTTNYMMNMQGHNILSGFPSILTNRTKEWTCNTCPWQQVYLSNLIKNITGTEIMKFKNWSKQAKALSKS